MQNDKNKLIICDNFELVFDFKDENFNGRKYPNIKEFYYKKKFIENLNNIIYDNTGDETNLNEKKLYSQFTNFDLFSNQSKAKKSSLNKYFKFEIKFDLDFLSKIETRKIEYFTFNDKYENCINNQENLNFFNNVYMDIFDPQLVQFLINNFINFSRKLFLIYNNINFKIFINNAKFLADHEKEMLAYKLIFEEDYNNFAKAEIENLSKFLSSYWNIEEENIFTLQGKYLSLIISFFEYRPIKKDECNNIEVLFLGNEQELIIGEQYHNYYDNFIQDNDYFKNALHTYDITFEDSKAFINKINKNNPFRNRIIDNYLACNNLEPDFFEDYSGLKYLKNSPIKNPNEYNIQIILQIKENEIKITNDDIYFEILQKDFNSLVDEIVLDIRKKNKNILLNSEERKHLKLIETNINKISSSILPVLVNTENENLISLMNKIIKNHKLDKQEKIEKEALEKNLEMKKIVHMNDPNELKKYEFIEALIDEENSDYKIQEILRKSIENNLKSKFSKD